ncbi:MAG: CDP-alcohol phosphatidyltransferase family protein [Clostridia bacterium]|nr:CDP-alcohol phosphatidyltransferase family protein [Clostridia bacterium]
MQIQWKWTVPNVLSLLRIAILPVFIILYIRSCTLDSAVLMYTAFGLLVLSGLTDCFDGWIARRFHQESEIGKLLDPVADKLTQVAVLIALATQYQEFLPLLAICTVKEMLQGLGGLIVLGKGVEMRSSKWYGKMSTVVFYIAVAAIVLWKDMPHWLVLALIALVGILMLFAFLRYLQLFLTIRKDVPSQQTVEVEGSNGK